MIAKWRNWVSKSIRNHLDTDDILQESLIRLWNNYDKVKNRSMGEASNYIRLIVRNITLDHIRKQKKTDSTIPFQFVYEDVADVDDYDDRIEDIEKMLKFLPNDQLLIINKRGDEMSFQEIADELGISVNTVLGRFRYDKINILKMIDDPMYRPCRSPYRKGVNKRYHLK